MGGTETRRRNHYNSDMPCDLSRAQLVRGIKEAADVFLNHYEAARGPLRNLGFWELASAARPLPNPAVWIPESRQMGDIGATDDSAGTDYYEFVENAIQRAREGH